ncbi:hypothetical protein NW762_014741 [Fusarium torreyae]|uniref:Uncharacterized protein n=1 Tax=Fusarium torreyae TaxID=1237075 RepID=A0A9W8V963_9HYPO|nr:hypothetical protein NW762_014741 [Fusarium torreyae]
MQMLLIVLCPRLKSLKYMYNKHDKVDRHRSLKWLTLVIGKAWTDASWPPGLQSLREVAVGVHSETWLDDDVPELWYTRSCFRGILKLPSIESLYFRGLRPQDHPTIEGEDTESDYEDNESPFNSSPAAELRHAADKLPARCSTVEHLYLDSIGDYDTFQSELAAAPKALKTYTLQSGAIDFFMIMDFDLLLDLVVEKQRQSIQSIMVYDASEFQGYRCRLYTLGHEIKIHDCPQLRQIHVQLHDLFTHTYYDFPWGRQGLTEAWKDPFKRQGCADFITRLFPTSLEVLVLGCAGVTMPDFVSMEMEQEILVNLVRSDRLPALKAIYLELPDLDTVYPFTKLIQVGWESGVDIHTRRNPHVPRHQVQFPMPPRAASHLSHGDIPQPEFDPFNGCWMASSQDMQLEGEPNEMSPGETFPALDIDDETEDDCASVRLRYY